MSDEESQKLLPPVDPEKAAAEKKRLYNEAQKIKMRHVRQHVQKGIFEPNCEFCQHRAKAKEEKAQPKVSVQQKTGPLQELIQDANALIYIENEDDPAIKQQLQQEIQKFGLETVRARDNEDNLHGLLDTVVDFINGTYTSEWLNDPSEIAALSDQFEELQATYRHKQRFRTALGWALHGRDSSLELPELEEFYKTVPTWPAPPEGLRNSFDVWLPRNWSKKDFFRRSDWWHSYAADDGVALDKKLAHVRGYICRHGFQVYQPEIPELVCPWSTSVVEIPKVKTTISPADVRVFDPPPYVAGLLDAVEITQALQKQPIAPANIVQTVENRPSLIDAAMKERGL